MNICKYNFTPLKRYYLIQNKIDIYKKKYGNIYIYLLQISKLRSVATKGILLLVLLLSKKFTFDSNI